MPLSKDIDTARGKVFHVAHRERVDEQPAEQPPHGLLDEVGVAHEQRAPGVAPQRHAGRSGGARQGCSPVTATATASTTTRRAPSCLRSDSSKTHKAHARCAAVCVCADERVCF